MNKSIMIGIFTIVFLTAGIVVFADIHDVSACPKKETNTAFTTHGIPDINNVNTLLSSPSLLQSSSSSSQPT